MTAPLVIASVSGGKDSAALSLWLHEQGIEHERVFADTGWEAPQTYDYLRGPLAEKLGPIVEVRSERDMVGWVRHKAMFPSRQRKFCTEELKVRPIFDYIFQRAAETARPVTNAVGVRADESRSRAGLPERDGYSDRRGDFDIWRPLIDWTEQDVIDIHRRHDLRPNPLYMAGARRVGCWPCIFARKDEVRLIVDTDPERIDLIELLEDEITDAADARSAARGVTNVHRRAWFAGRGPKKSGGAQAMMPIRDVVEWVRTDKGGRQFTLFDVSDPDEGCVRWGMCEHPDGDA